MIDILFIAFVAIMTVVGEDLFPMYAYIFKSLMIVILAGVGIFADRMYFRLIVKDKKMQIFLNWIFFIIGIALTILSLMDLSKIKG
ncbi:MAG: hypothetical protein R2941_25815 [Desulfobacterales bacterium]